MFDFKNYDRDKKLAHLWWRELSINEMKAFVKKHCPIWYISNLPTTCLVNIYRKEGI